MARPSAHSSTDVDNAAKDLIRRGLQVTPSRIRTQLRGGSFGWIKDTLDALGYNSNAGLPEGLDETTAALIKATQPLVELLQQQASKTLDAETEAHNKLVKTLSDQNAELLADNDKLRAKITELEIQSSEASKSRVFALNELAECQKELTETKQQVTRNEGAIKSLENRLVDGEKLSTHLRENLQQFREMSKEQMQEARSAHQSELLAIREQLKNAQKKLNLSREDVISLNRHNAELFQIKRENENRIMLLKDEISIIKNSARTAELEASEQLSKVKQQQAADKARLEQLSEDLGELKGAYSSALLQIETLKSLNEMEASEVKELRLALSKANNQKDAAKQRHKKP